uniref:Reverse transcriptase domain-containing protein n=1 Tax=Chromera velia CCMP2878 TaxID=1169474 RepID=A0A0G4HC10_9ALVE|eukprot:Cvel_26095.t1-p1 / transcript=Cvel_26095.t1 / gene=Cvel_26095 / organism=Chromera_velia_CCMP2878 / gene_product=LINE-1 reverse transcriptase homolog, putative / transcript_product=LINE-1 reverse transcriptase homolog, putative / location=Cvel_scaffold3049:12515-13834(+) / protein_length=440 / sequence_SO=supercontig / SO=protein_coding / is_pseudo=false
MGPLCETYRRVKTEYHQAVRAYQKKDREEQQRCLGRAMTAGMKGMWEVLKELKKKQKTTEEPVVAAGGTNGRQEGPAGLEFVQHFVSIFREKERERGQRGEAAEERERGEEGREEGKRPRVVIEEGELFTEEEVIEQIMATKKKKATRLDRVLAEHLYVWAESVVFRSTVTSLFNLFLMTGWVPKGWNDGLIAPIIKAGKPMVEAGSYRPIHLLSHVSNVYSSLLDKRIRGQQGVSICREQFGFQKGKGTRDATFVLRHLLIKHREPGLHCVFVDLKEAFDSVDRRRLWDRLREKNVKEGYVRAVASLYRRVRASVLSKGQGGGEEGKQAGTFWFPEQRGVKQGDPLSPLFFMLYINDLPTFVKEQRDERRGDPPGKPLTVGNWGGHVEVEMLFYADDLVIVEKKQQRVQWLLEGLERYCEERGLVVNMLKTYSAFFGSA